MIKKILLTALCISATYIVHAQAPARISGSLKNSKTQIVKLYAVSEGKNVEIATAKVNKANRFGFQFFPEYEGVYSVGTGTGLIPTDVFKFYFKPGDELNVELNDTSYVLQGNNTKENQVIAQWHNASYQVERNAVISFRENYIVFFPQLESLAKTSATFLKGKATGNARFDQFVKKMINLDMALYAANFLRTPRTAHPAKEELSPFYSSLNLKDIATTTATTYDYPFGARLISMMISLDMKKTDTKPLQGVDAIKQLMPIIPNDTLKGDQVLEYAQYTRNFEKYRVIMDEAGKYVLTASQKARAQEIMLPLAEIKKGDQGLDFAYADKNGKTVKMSDLKGKVVLVDVWATWCGPCKAEIPSLKALEEEMKGKDVQIVSVSVDEFKDKAKWEKMIVDEKLGGLQLFAGGSGNVLSKYYKVNTIPRFLVFDKNGKIVDIDAPRPSDPKLKTLLESELAK